MGQFSGSDEMNNPYSARIDFSRQNLTSVTDSDDKSRSPHCKNKHITNGRRPIT